MKRLFYILTLLTFVTACSEDEWVDNVLTQEQQSMIGSAVNFELSVADPFTTRISYNRNGSFNQGDLMMIYRQYEENGQFDWNNEIFRAYDYKYQTAPGTDVVLKRDWRPCTDTEGNKIARQKGDYSPSGTSRTLSLNPQTEADSLTWENGKTVRFRAWSRSNLSNAITNTSKTYYYPDFCISDWVTVSGPTKAIPLSLKHLGCRISFFYRGDEGAGNRLGKVEVSTDAEDYKRDDNADSTEADVNDKIIKDKDGNELTAEQAAANVEEAFKKMSLPCGVDIETGLLRAMTQDAYTKTTNFSKIEEWEYTEDGRKNYVSFGQLSTEDVKTKVQHPVFAYNDARYYLVTIPYDISKENGGEPITLPPYTRIKVWLNDVNSGDETTNNGLESNYHIFSLSDVKNSDDTDMFPDGLELLPGYDYEFRVGYRYDHMTITAGDNFSWETDTEENWEGQSEQDIVTPASANTYKWWKDAIDAAVKRAIDDGDDYMPEFHIKTVEEFLEFIKLVNGDAAKPGVDAGKIYHLVKEYETITNPNGTISKKPKTYGWSKTNNEKNPQWVDKSTLEAQGYVFYEQYYPSDATREAGSEENYLQTPFSFCDEKYGTHFTVYIDCDLDFKDQKIASIGKKKVTLGNVEYKAFFKGFFDGYSKLSTEAESARQAHTLKNLNVDGYYLFNYVNDAAIRNLKIETTHTVGILNEAEPTKNENNDILGWGCNIVGISIKANNTVAGVSAIAKSLSGPSVVVGCIHEGDAAGPLVGAASDLRMYGCMRTANNISGDALLGEYLSTAAGYKKNFFAPQISISDQRSKKNFSKKPTWGVFMCNYYSKDRHELSKDALAMHAEAKSVSSEDPTLRDDYSVLEYIRGCQSRILRAVYDNKLSRDVPLSSLSERQLEEYYGLAPWKAMNYAIYKYNADARYIDHPCMMHYEVSTIGYDHLYPQLKSGKPSEKWTSETIAEWNVLDQNN